MATPENLALWALLSSAIAKYPRLHSRMPAGWPLDPHFNITAEQLTHYMASRRGVYVINLPLVLYNIETNPRHSVSDLFSSIMKRLDSFCGDFVATGVPGADKIVHPVWSDNWNLNDSRFFAAVAEIYFAYFLRAKGQVIKEFEKLYNPGASRKSADACFDFSGKEVYLDIKSPKLERRYWFRRQFRKDIEQKAQSLLSVELQALRPNCFGVVAMLYRPLGKSASWFKFKSKALDPIKHPTDPNKFAQVYWIKPVFTVTGRDLVVFDNTFDFSPYLMKPVWKRLFLTYKSRLKERFGL